MKTPTSFRPGPRFRPLIERIAFHAGPCEGRPIRIRFGRELTVARGKLLSAAGKGEPVHAASHIRRREMVLDESLARRPAQLKRIFVHELFHFVWVRLDNSRRASWARLVRSELERGARGELGWPAESRKQVLAERGRNCSETAWREYVCESFCDTAAFLYAGLRTHDEWTLGLMWRERRARWFQAVIAGRPVLL